LEKRVAEAEEPAGERNEPSSVLWLGLLRLALPALERGEQTPAVAAAIDRVRRSIPTLEGYVARYLPSDPWAYLEYYCHGCLRRLTWTQHGWEKRQLAFLDPGYDEHMRQIVEIETARRRLPQPYTPWPPALPTEASA
jgi:hypothetical protein